jgi:hypothetical protein
MGFVLRTKSKNWGAAGIIKSLKCGSDSPGPHFFASIWQGESPFYTDVG